MYAMPLSEASPSISPKGMAQRDTAGTLDAGELRVHEGRVVVLRLRARLGTVAGTVVVQELPREVTAGNGYRGATGHVSVDEEGATLPKRYLPRAIISAGSSAVMFAEKSLMRPVISG
jgi:hypothetical protein